MIGRSRSETCRSRSGHRRRSPTDFPALAQRSPAPCPLCLLGETVDIYAVPVSIWVYRETAGESEDLLGYRAERMARSRVCVYCGTRMRLLFHGGEGEADVRVCDMCGWWANIAGFRSPEGWLNFHGNYGVLRNLNLADIATPLAEIRRYLLAKFDSRFELHPRLLEHAVADLMRDFGHEAEVTAYSGDGGIDVILRDPNGTIGIQVKRYKDKIEVEQVRSLTGALVLAGHTRGVFLTTSEFQPGAQAAADRAGERGIAIDLIDAPSFLSALEIASQPPYETADEWRNIVGQPESLDLGGHLID